MVGGWVSSRHANSWTVRRRFIYGNIFGIRRISGNKSPVPTKLNWPRPRQIISTLHPARITDSDFVDLSIGAPCARLYTSNSMRSSMIKYFGGFNHRFLFPENCRGFLYYHLDPLLPAISGTVRFRVTQNSRASSFAAGTDLELPHCPIPWTIWLGVIVNSSTYAGLEELLRRDDLVSPSLLQRCKDLRRKNKLRVAYHNMLFTLDQPFFYDVNTSPCISVVGLEGIERAQTHFTREYKIRVQERCFHPYAGQCTIRFERSSRPEHVGRRVVVWDDATSDGGGAAHEPWTPESDRCRCGRFTSSQMFAVINVAHVMTWMFLLQCSNEPTIRLSNNRRLFAHTYSMNVPPPARPTSKRGKRRLQGSCFRTKTQPQTSNLLPHLHSYTLSIGRSSDECFSEVPKVMKRVMW
ncbi:hypothetical protein Hypma_011294 [Hypsizygus marmoreus]|uniref:Uncharacterized protein n=1 Tax=Hypsizygus marmoreus TaxID=39966 RepID=A0A369JHN4_HYPMA|nr:hypothetical protein Hypma_011294 [Hypsizygus marmoreus]